MNKISAVIPVYNRAEWIVATLDRILDQTVSVDEIVICDDGSVDDLNSVIESYSKFVKVVSIENSGPAIARKTAIEHSTGNWIALCDSDDYWFSCHIARFKTALNKYPTMNFYFSNFWQSDNEEDTKFDFAPENWSYLLSGDPRGTADEFVYCNANLYPALLEFQCCFQSTCIFSRELYDSIGGIDPEVSRWQAEDAHLTRRLAAYGKAVVDKKPSVMINKHGGNFSNNIIGNFEGRIRILEKLVGDDDLPEKYRAWTEKEISSSRIKLFRLYYWHGQKYEAINIFKQIDFKEANLKDYIRFVLSILKYLIKRPAE